MRNLALLLVFVSALARADVVVLDEGTQLGPVIFIDFVGPGVTCTRTNQDGTVTITG